MRPSANPAVQTARTTHIFRGVHRLLAVVAVVLLAGAVQTASAAARTHHRHAAKHHALRASRHPRAHAPAQVTRGQRSRPPLRRPPERPPPPCPRAAPATCSGGDLVPTSANLAQVGAATLCLINQQRAAAGLPALRETAALDAAAASHSADMVAKNYFDHVAPTGLGLVDQVLGAGYATVGTLLDLGENIATGVDSLATPASTVASWMASPPPPGQHPRPPLHRHRDRRGGRRPGHARHRRRRSDLHAVVREDRLISGRPPYWIRSGVPTLTRRDRRTMSALRSRMHPCDGCPGTRPGSSVPWRPTTPPPGQSVSAA